MNAERLMGVVAVLERTPDEAFDLGSWRCGSVACAVGHYVLAHPDRGLKLVPHIYSDELEGEGFVGWPSVEQHFQLSEKDAAYLFYQGAYRADEDDEDLPVTRDEVAHRIREYVASGGKAGA